MALARRSADAEYRVAEQSTQTVFVKKGSRHLARGWAIVLRQGRPETWRCLLRREPGRPESAQVVKRIRRLRKAWPEEVLIGKAPAENPIWAPKATLATRKLEMVATAYDPGPVDRFRGEVGTTSIGLRAHFGIIAVDPKVIRYRSLLYVEGYGLGLAGDTGGAIKGKRLDLCFNSTREANAWGRQKVKVYVLGYLPRGQAREVEALTAKKKI
jgi:3D (Asp-Asp-Asp) domain-containing protein